jgi:hypothetical protein
MYWIIENKEQLREFFNQDYKEVFVEVIPFHNSIHPALNDVSLVYIRPLADHKGYMLGIDHSETLSIGKTYVEKHAGATSAILKGIEKYSA